MSGKTTIQVSRETKTKLNEMGKKGDTYDDIIQKLLKNYDITLPKLETLKNDAQKWHLLEKEDFKYILNDSPLIHASNNVSYEYYGMDDSWDIKKELEAERRRSFNCSDRMIR